MSETLLQTISQYGYLAIILLVLLQEIGFPTPIPNEYLLLFTGYLSSTGTLKVVLVLISVITADLIAGLILYELFFHTGKLLLRKKPKWIPLPKKSLIKLSVRIKTSKNKETFIGRLTPFIRGWVSVISGMLQIPQKNYFTVLLSSSILWATAYIGCGYFLGPHIQSVFDHSLIIGSLLLLLPLTGLLLFKLFFSKYKTIQIKK